MAPRQRVRSAISLLCILAVLCSGPGASALSTWKDGGDDFRSGNLDGTLEKNGTVELDLSNITQGNWAQVLDWVGPPAIRGHSMVYDPINGLVILFGGESMGDKTNETWVYDPATKNWTERNPINAPPPREDFAMAFDEKNGVAVIYSGRSKLNDTWTYNATTDTWTNITKDINPGRRADAGMVYDSMNGIILLFGGFGGDKSDDLNDTWSLNVATGEWTLLEPAISPAARNDFGMAFDKGSGEAILFGGLVDGVSDDETWAYSYETDNWTQLFPEGSPVARTRHRMAYDESQRVIVIFGGEINGAKSDETWTFDSAACNWTRKNPPQSPAGRYWFGFAYDAHNGRSILHGGSGVVDTWSYDTGNDSWSFETSLGNPLPRGGSAMVYDKAAEASLLFGAMDSSDTWIYRSKNNSWTQMKTTVSPGPRWEHAMTYDTSTGVAILFGGYYRNGNSAYTHGDTWTYDFRINEWNNKTVNGNPSPPNLCLHAMAYDAKNRVSVLFGGLGDWQQASNETWLYYATNNSWIEANPPDAPAARYSHSMAYDEGIGQVILFGGSNDTEVFKDTWTFDVGKNIWMRRATATGPIARYHSTMVYDSAVRQVVLFGGGSTNDNYFNDTWLYDSRSDIWVQKRPTTSPSMRCNAASCYDPVVDRVILFSGWGHGWIPPDVWKFNISKSGIPAGTFTSRPLDTGGEAYFGSMEWEGILPGIPGETSILFQTRAGDSLQDLALAEFVGPDGTRSSFYDSSGQQLSSAENGSRFVQYRAWLSSAYGLVTPTLLSITVNFNLMHELRLFSPIGAENWSEMAQITWSVLDPDNDPISVDIYLENDSSSTLLFGNLPAESASKYWNTNDTPNGTFRIRIVARDDNPSIPLSVAEVSENFTIFHPPPKQPNRPPHVELLSPSNASVINTTSVRLLWNGSDPDGDQLDYIIHFSKRPFDELAGEFIPTREEFLDFYDLEDGATYYWTVDAGDGFNRTSESPLPVWHFTVSLPKPPPPVNHHPRITSTPALTARVNETWTYRIVAVDEDGDGLEFSMAGTPEGMVLDSPNGTLSWTPRAGQEGNHTIAVSVSDGKGGLDSQLFGLSVLGIPPPPVVLPNCTIDRPGNGTTVKGTLKVAGRAFNGSFPLAAVHFRIDGGPWQTAGGLANWTSSLDTRKLSNGAHMLEARAYDGVRYSNTTAILFNVQNPAERVSTGNQYCQPALILATILGLVFVLSLAFRKNNDQG